MNKPQSIMLIIAIINILMMLVFPPFDYISVSRSIPTFDGFYFLFGENVNRQINASFLYLELFVVMLNTAIAWLLLQPKTQQKITLFNYQNVVLIMVGINLVMVMLFPPFQYFYAVTSATLPSFDGFYFLFSDNTKRAIVAPILYIEVFLVLINGAIFWLLLSNKSLEIEMTPDQARAVAAELLRKSEKSRN